MTSDPPYPSLITPFVRYTLRELREAGYSIQQLHAIGGDVTPQALLSAGFSQLELRQFLNNLQRGGGGFSDKKETQSKNLFALTRAVKKDEQERKSFALPEVVKPALHTRAQSLACIRSPRRLPLPHRWSSRVWWRCMRIRPPRLSRET